MIIPDGAGTMQNTITVKYEAVWYDRGPVTAGAMEIPKGFGDPCPITILHPSLH